MKPKIEELGIPGLDERLTGVKPVAELADGEPYKRSETKPKKEIVDIRQTYCSCGVTKTLCRIHGDFH